MKRWKEKKAGRKEIDRQEMTPFLAAIDHRPDYNRASN
jgi:hypothetical protein